MLKIEDESAFIASLKSGDEKAFAELVDRHHAGLMRMAMIFVSTRAAAEELVQETWVSVIRGIDRFERRSSLKTWIFAIMTNKAKKRAGKDARTVNLSSFDEHDIERMFDPDEGRFTARNSWQNPPSAWKINPEERVQRNELLEVIARTVETLPPKQKLVFTMRDVQGIDVSDISECLEITDSYQRVLLHRARATIRAAIESYLGERGGAKPC